MNRRTFLEKLLLIGGLSVTQPWQLVGLSNPYQVGECEAGSLPLNNIVWGDKLVDPSVGLSGLVSHGRGGGDATFVATEETSSAYLFPLGKNVTKVFKLDVTAPGAATSWYNFTFSANYIPNSFGQFIWPVWSTYNSFAGLPPKAVVLLAQESTFTNTWTYQYSVPMNSYLNQGTERYDGPVLRRTSPNGTAGAPNPAVSFTRVQLRIEVPAGVTGTYYLAPLMVRNAITPRVAIVFDDGTSEEYTNAYPYMLERGIPGSCAIIGDLRNGLSLAQMLEMQSQGWSMHNHTYSHPNMTTLTEAQILDELRQCQNVLNAAGLGNSGRNVMIPPFGAGNSTIDQIITRSYPYVARMTGEGMRGYYGLLRCSTPPTTLSRYSIDVPTSLATITTAIINFLAQGQDICLYGHKPANGAPSGELELATLKGIIDLLYKYQAAGKIRCVNLDELVTGLSNPRRKRV